MLLAVEFDCILSGKSVRGGTLDGPASRLDVFADASNGVAARDTSNYEHAQEYQSDDTSQPTHYDEILRSRKRNVRTPGVRLS